MFLVGIWKLVKGSAAWFKDAVPGTVKIALLIALLALAILVGTHWYAFSQGYGKAVAEASAAAKERDRLQSIAQSRQTKEQLDVTKDLRARAVVAEKAKEQADELLRKAKSYVTPKADRACTITSGFERVYNAAATGTAGSLPGSGTMDVDEATGIKISDVAEVTIENLSECRQRGEVISAWQEWYYRSKAIFSQAQGIACGTIAVPQSSQ